MTTKDKGWWCPRCNQAQSRANCDYDAKMSCEVFINDDGDCDVVDESTEERTSNNAEYSCLSCGASMKEQG